MREICVVCRSMFTPSGASRSGVYCSAACRQRRDRELSMAARELARDSVPRNGDVFGALERAQLLWVTWTARDQGGPLARRSELLARFWGGSRPPKRLSPPSREAVAALGRRITRLSEKAREAERRAREAHAQRERDQERRRAAAERKRQADADSAWRRELLGG